MLASGPYKTDKIKKKIILKDLFSLFLFRHVGHVSILKRSLFSNIQVWLTQQEDMQQVIHLETLDHHAVSQVRRGSVQRVMITVYKLHCLSLFSCAHTSYV